VKAAAAVAARVDAFRVHGVAALDRLRSDPAGVQDDLAEALHLSGDDAGFLAATARALTGRLPATLSLMDKESSISRGRARS